MHDAEIRETKNGQRVDDVRRGITFYGAQTACVDTGDDIARRAFELHCGRGRPDGHDVDDWLDAERELKHAASSSAAWALSCPVNTFIDQQVLERLRAEYLEMPDMRLTSEQVQRLCGIEPTMCKRVLNALVKASFLCVKSDGTYLRLTEGSSPRPGLATTALKSIPFVTTSRRAS
jgi:hypothetical protein